MASKTLFRNQSKIAPAATTTNEAGGKAYELSARHALAQYACTSTLGGTYYTSATDQLHKLKALVTQVEPEFLAKVALYAREKGKMKDLPAYLAACLSINGGAYLKAIFSRVIDDGRMLRNFVQIIRSGQVGRKSLGSLPKRLCQKWFESHTAEQIFRNSIGNDPSLGQVLALCHANPGFCKGGEAYNRHDLEKEAIFKYLRGQKYNSRNLPTLVQDYESYKLDKSRPVPPVHFMMLDGMGLTDAGWKEVAKTSNWTTTIKNLNTFARHNVFKDGEIVSLVAERLKSRKDIKATKAFPYQIMTAYSNVTDMPFPIKDALQDAMEIATENVPVYEGQVYVCVDVSGSMKSAVTGSRGSATSSVRCVDAAALVAASILRLNKSAKVIPFETGVVNLELNGRDSIMTNATKLASVGGGGTNCSAPLKMLNGQNAKGDLVIYVSDNESWVDSSNHYAYSNGGDNNATGLMQEWLAFKSRNRGAKLVCIDLTPNTTSQVSEKSDILLVGGFSDEVFNVIQNFSRNDGSPDFWVKEIEKVSFLRA